MASARVVIKVNRLPEIKARFPRETSELIREQVFESEAHVKTNVVKYDVIDTGNLLGSVQGEITGAFSGQVFVGAEYAPYQNFGTAFISPRPFFSDEVHRAETAFPERFRALESRL